MTQKIDTLQWIIIAVVFMIAVWYMYGYIENFEAMSRSALIGNPVPIITQQAEINQNLELCDPENNDIKNNMKKGINIIYMNHVNNNIKKIIDDNVNIKLLTEKMEKINNELMLRLHRNKKYDTEGEMTFV